MTIICVRDGVMAADSAVWCGDTIIGHHEKITRTSGYELVGCAGSFAAARRFLEWYGQCGFYGVQDADPFDAHAGDDGFSALILHPRGTLYCGLTGLIVSEKMFPWSLAGDATAVAVATGALMMGATAQQAVEICIERASYAAGKVQVMKLTNQHGDESHGESSQHEVEAV